VKEGQKCKVHEEKGQSSEFWWAANGGLFTAALHFLLAFSIWK